MITRSRNQAYTNDHLAEFGCGYDRDDVEFITIWCHLDICQFEFTVDRNDIILMTFYEIHYSKLSVHLDSAPTKIFFAKQQFYHMQLA